MRSLDEEDVKNLMYDDAYQNQYNQKYNKTVAAVEQSFQCLYPNDDRNVNPQKYYVWHCVEDDKTRAAHAERDGKVFCWNNPPEGGHPGEDYNCRCWAEDYEPPLSRMHESQKQDYEYLTFDGRELSLYKNGEKIKSWNAMSGKPEYQCDKYQDVPNKGPLPEGEWLVKQSNHQNFFDDQDRISQLKSNLGLGKWPGGTDS